MDKEQKEILLDLIDNYMGTWNDEDCTTEECSEAFDRLITYIGALTNVTG